MNKSPDAFRTISEVAELLATPAHVLRFWESRFPQIRPVKRAGGRRYYRPADVALLTGIKRLLHDEGLTIRGVQKILREQGVRHVSGMLDEATTTEDDAALEAALAASGDDADADPAVPPTLPPAEAETAQIIALQSALGPDDAAAPDASAKTPDASPARDDNDLFSRLAKGFEADHSKPAPSDAGAAHDPAQPTAMRPPGARDLPPAPPHFATPGTPPTADAPPQDPVEEAPMQVWAEPEPDHIPETEPTVIPALKVTRIGATPVQPPPPPTQDDSAEVDIMATIVQRLRATKPDSLNPSDRATLSVLRAKARSLRDRLANPPRSGL